MAIDSRLLIGGPKAAPPVIMENRETKEKTAFPAVGVAVITPQVMAQLVNEITANVTRNVIVNLCARLKDRCAHVSSPLKGKGLCGISRAAHHVNDHDFTEPTAPKADA